MVPASLFATRWQLALPLVLVQVTSALAQDTTPIWRDTDWVSAKAKAAYFHISVKGTLADGEVGQREGKAFAVGPNLLVTSQHLVGGSSEWKPATGIVVEVARAMHAVDRGITLRRVEGPPTKIENPNVLAAADLIGDAAGISVPAVKLDTRFRLSMCDIVQGHRYASIMTSADDPSDPSSIELPLLVELNAAGYQPAKYGPLYIFDLVDNPSFSGEPNGHDGSPILDEDGSVVAVVSAVTAKPGGNGYNVLATPIQPQFPSAAALLARAPDVTAGAEDGLKCSLSETVKRINDQVAAHASWTLRVDHEEDGRPKDEIFIRYESVAAEPNIDSIKVGFDFWGKQRKEAPTRRLTYSDTTINEIQLTRSAPFSNREFSTSEIVLEGKRQVETLLNEKKEGGYIDYVEVRVFETHLIDGRTLTKETVLNFKWKQP
ncbi:hypothetical protein [Rhizobium ruizarguesonis]|uniref:hypothetical protein n=1 Tax=Rhizobium ruizarguesonis TaxID=2081791 RepID=UPI001031374A|nr:hypothetical protein [Rhizobium ruizarguesonis]NEH81839.1 hypothetical protein [Rhizobium ruizarguesonis]NEI79455.1 hypothetical protein [Rhizobium ruizarguesonis]TBA20208.1 hypothetical protein ELH66_03880 [Rhizobium ruizarguesonis]TBD62643.1 hypothetical protein ELH22_04475 [Rhizobium ruizarguesonis]